MTPDTPAGDVLRAQTLQQYVGQQAIKERLAVHIKAALKDGRMLDHVLLSAPAGFGKTSLAQVIAAELGDPFYALTMPMKPVALASFFRQFTGGVVLLDELHRASQSQQEDLLGLLEDGILRLASGHVVHVPHLTAIGATTEPEKVIPPLYDRFVVKPVFEAYTDDEMGTIVLGMATKLCVPMDIEFATELGRATGGTPRAARQLVLAARDLRSNGHSLDVGGVLELCGVESDGLGADHLRYLKTLAQLGGQGGLSIVSSMLHLHPSIIQDLERLLVKHRYIFHESSGRSLTEAGWRRVRTNTAPPLRRVS